MVAATVAASTARSRCRCASKPIGTAASNPATTLAWGTNQPAITNATQLPPMTAAMASSTGCSGPRLTRAATDGSTRSSGLPIHSARGDAFSKCTVTAPAWPAGACRWAHRAATPEAHGASGRAPR